MKIQANSRQIPSSKTVTSNKKYYDILYSLLQEKSHPDIDDDGNPVRYLDKKEVTGVQLAKDLQISRQTASSWFKKLEELKLVKWDLPHQRYVLTYLEKSLCTLVPQDTLRQMNNALSRYAVSLFVYLMNRYLAAGETEYQTTMAQMKEYIGIATSTTSNNDVINDILFVLTKLGLIEYEVRYEDNKTHIYIKKVNNVIK